MMKHDDLVPCPFCGCPAMYDVRFSEMWYVKCINKSSCDLTMGAFWDKEEARDAWNRRSAWIKEPTA